MLQRNLRRMAVDTGAGGAPDPQTAARPYGRRLTGDMAWFMT